MAIYIALLRGINVSGKNMIKMTELKRLFEALGYSRVQTYINSGNVVFEAEKEEQLLQQQIEREIEARLGLSIKVVLRTGEQLEQVLAECPFIADVAPDGKNVHAGLLQEAPAQEAIARLLPYKGPDEFQVIGREIYLLFREGIARSKLANNLPKLGVPVTTRNWNTINKLVALAQAMV